VTRGPHAGYSEIADAQLDELERLGSSAEFDAVAAACEWILDEPGQARARSAAIATVDGIRFRFAVPGTDGVKVFWSSEGPRIEAVFPYPT
jgi:hypothetical protein